MEQPPDHQPCRQTSVDESDDETIASTLSTTTDVDEVRESDEDFIEADSEASHSTEDYQDHVVTSEGSSEHWDDEPEDEDDGAKYNEADERADDDDTAADEGFDHGSAQGTPESQGHAPVNVAHVLEGTLVHESLLASLIAVLRSLDVHSRDAVHHARDARGGGAYDSTSPEPVLASSTTL
ncbi:hypothetical protein LTR70_010699 [Exophiala xenobiotica]|uniref:Uncharacterized protein n=1 Tax=Lithohypha guttulata TaxID=1690604 RepID=A0ABR0JT63_9EURO|nr:hypothetical protein LTR24_010685 [Lithohypha guttulata]KAK5308972.1 hypothetical protein LTR70_010699 [Exophiala xenobiotica]